MKLNHSNPSSNSNPDPFRSRLSFSVLRSLVEEFRRKHPDFVSDEIRAGMRSPGLMAALTEDIDPLIDPFVVRVRAAIALSVVDGIYGIHLGAKFQPSSKSKSPKSKSPKSKSSWSEGQDPLLRIVDEKTRESEEKKFFAPSDSVRRQLGKGYGNPPPEEASTRARTLMKLSAPLREANAAHLAQVRTEELHGFCYMLQWFPEQGERLLQTPLNRRRALSDLVESGQLNALLERLGPESVLELPIHTLQLCKALKAEDLPLFANDLAALSEEECVCAVNNLEQYGIVIAYAKRHGTQALYNTINLSTQIPNYIKLDPFMAHPTCLTLEQHRLNVLIDVDPEWINILGADKFFALTDGQWKRLKDFQRTRLFKGNQRAEFLELFGIEFIFSLPLPLMFAIAYLPLQDIQKVPMALLTELGAMPGIEKCDSTGLLHILSIPEEHRKIVGLPVLCGLSYDVLKVLMSAPRCFFEMVPFQFLHKHGQGLKSGFFPSSVAVLMKMNEEQLRAIPWATITMSDVLFLNQPLFLTQLASLDARRIEDFFAKGAFAAIRPHDDYFRGVRVYARALFAKPV